MNSSDGPPVPDPPDPGGASRGGTSHYQLEYSTKSTFEPNTSRTGKTLHSNNVNLLVTQRNPIHIPEFPPVHHSLADGMEISQDWEGDGGGAAAKPIGVVPKNRVPSFPVNNTDKSRNSNNTVIFK